MFFSERAVSVELSATLNCAHNVYLPSSSIVASSSTPVES